MKTILDAAAREERRTHVYNNYTHRLENSTFALGPLDGNDEVSVEYGARMEYASFDDLWSPIAAGEGSMGKYAAPLDPDGRAALERALRFAYEAGKPDGPRSFAAVAWACRGTVA